MSKSKGPRKPGSSGDVSDELDGEISRRLKAMYRAMESEDIPERFLILLEKLERAERAQSGGQSDE